MCIYTYIYVYNFPILGTKETCVVYKCAERKMFYILQTFFTQYLSSITSKNKGTWKIKRKLKKKKKERNL